jgi:hypothetical protein
MKGGSHPSSLRYDAARKVEVLQLPRAGGGLEYSAFE